MISGLFVGICGLFVGISGPFAGSVPVAVLIWVFTAVGAAEASIHGITTSHGASHGASASLDASALLLADCPLNVGLASEIEHLAALTRGAGRIGANTTKSRTATNRPAEDIQSHGRSPQRRDGQREARNASFLASSTPEYSALLLGSGTGLPGGGAGGMGSNLGSSAGSPATHAALAATAIPLGVAGPVTRYASELALFLPEPPGSELLRPPRG